MALTFKQFRYFGENSDNNNITKEELENGSFCPDYSYITSLGIRAIPGTIFSINGGLAQIGPSGVFDLNFPEKFLLKSFLFTNLNTLVSLNGIYIIIDIVGEEK